MPGLGPTPKLLASHKVNPKRVPNVPLFDEVEEPDDEGGPIEYPDKVLDNPHPMDLKEGIIEKLVKKVANWGDYVDADRIYLEQYLHPERDIIPKQPLRPTRGAQGPQDNMEYRRLPHAEPMKIGPNEYKPYPLADGLGKFIKSKGDKYNSIYDEWDFNTNAKLFGEDESSPLSSAANWAAKKFMQNVGTPFKVYERFNKDELPEYFDPKYNMMQQEPGTATPLDNFGDLSQYKSTDVYKDEEGNLIIGKKKGKK